MSSDVTQPKIFRTYSHRGSSLNPTLVEALCATIAGPPFFTPMKIGPRGREQTFVGGPLGANNPTRELLREAGAIYGNNRRVAQIISLGAGISGAVSIQSVASADVASHLLKSLATDCEIVASELSARLFAVDAYVRLDVDCGGVNAAMDDWSGVGAMEARTDAYVEGNIVAHMLDESLRYLQARVGTATLGQISAYLIISSAFAMTY
jgi:hypothetical protein